MFSHTEELIASLDKLGRYIESKPEKLQQALENTFHHNRWFTAANTQYALDSMAGQYLRKEMLEKWLQLYKLNAEHPPVKVGLIMAGNIPLVGLHDLLSVLVTGNTALLKLSSKDNILLPFLLQELFNINPRLQERIEITERLNDAHAIIATGSNNSSRYFEYYFARFPKIIRRNRGSVCVLTGDETQEDFLNLGTDIFRYFGLGCRNVSKLYVPEGYSFNKFFEGIEGFKDIDQHSKYKNNYDYNRTLLLMNKTPHLANDFLAIKEDEAISSPIATVHYEFYNSQQDLKNKLELQRDNIQCIAGKGFLPFGQTQNPSLSDYADNVDTIQFLDALIK